MSQKIDIGVSSTTENKILKIKGARTINSLQLPSQNLIENEIKKYKHLSELDFKFYKDATPKLLIGQDHWHIITPQDLRTSTISKPVASLTALGWVVHGNLTATTHRKMNATMVTIDEKTHCRYEQETRERELNSLIKQNFDIEALGVTSNDKQNPLNKRVEQLLLENTRRIGKRWETGHLWKEENMKMPCNKKYAFQRLKSI